MRISDEALLMLLALALYLADSALLLASNEAVLLRRGDGWVARFGLDRWRLAGKEPCLPNPLTPHRPLFRLRWRFGAPEAPEAPDAPDSPDAWLAGRFRPVAVPEALDALRVHAAIALGCLFVLLPATLFVPVGSGYVLAVVAAFYANLAVALVRVHRRRESYGLAPGAFAVLALECAFCPPFAVNLVRKLCARLAVGEDFVRAAERLLPPAELAAVRAQCRRRLDEQIDYAPEGSERMRNLVAGRARFIADEAE